jgi:4-amino-4-deoxy-L-arabinose transferase-like glycosyltransferase
MSRKATKSKKEVAAKQAKPLNPVWIAIGLGIVGALIIISGVNYYGFTYDEPIYAGFGARSAKWLLGLPGALFSGELGQYLSAQTIDNAWFATIDMQPPLVQVLSGLSTVIFGGAAGGAFAPRLQAALFFGIAITCLFWLTDKIAGRRAAFFTCIGLTLLPRFFGDAHLTTLDVPTAALVLATAAVYYAAAQRNSWRLAMVAGVLLGLGLLTKLNAAFIIAVLGIWTLWFHRQMLIKAAVAFLLIAPLVFLIGWPWLWHDTFTNLGKYLGFHLHHYPVLTFYLGRIYEYAPWHYPFVIIAVTTPVLFLLLMLAGLARAVARRPAREGEWLLVLGALLFILPSAMPFAPKYNGVRLFLPAFPFLMALAGGAFTNGSNWLATRLEKRMNLGQLANLPAKLTLLLGLIIMLPALIGIVKISPYELAYYNTLIGGPRGAQRHGFETIYWGGPYLEALSFLNQFTKSDAKVMVTPQGVTSLLIAYQRAGALRQDMQWTTPPPPQRQISGWPNAALRDVDLVVFQCAQAEFDELSRRLYSMGGKPGSGSIYQVAREGVPLLLVFSGEEARKAFGVTNDAVGSRHGEQAGDPSTSLRARPTLQLSRNLQPRSSHEGTQ